MPKCESLITKDIDVNCDSAPVGGLESNAVIINRNDIDFGTTTFATGKKNVIESLTLKTGKKGYSAYVPGTSPYTGTTTTLNVGTYSNTFNNQFNVVILDNGPEVCSEIIDGLANGSFVVVFENKLKGAAKDAAFQIFGFYQGLAATELSNDKYSEDTNGGWSAVLTEERAPKSGLFLFKTDYASTKSLFDSLTAAVSPTSF